MAATTTPNVEEQLAWEAQWAPRAAIAAILAGVASLAGTIITSSAVKGSPQVTLTDGLRDIADPTSTTGGLLEPLLIHRHDNVLGFTAGQLVTALSGPLAALALVYLYRATLARNPNLNRATVIALVAGGVATFVGIAVGSIAQAISISDFVSSSNHGTIAAHDALQPSGALAGGWIAFLGRFALVVGIVLVSLNAMRVGLLTRFMGFLGIIAGASMILLGMPIVQAFWLVFLGVLFLGKFPNGTPPAWESGRAEPWPTRQQMLEAQGKLPGSGKAPAKNAPPPVTDPIDSAPGREHARSKKKKRRR
jgi:hypothetical protein